MMTLDATVAESYALTESVIGESNLQIELKNANSGLVAATHEFKVFHTVEFVPDPVVDTGEVTVT